MMAIPRLPLALLGVARNDISRAERTRTALQTLDAEEPRIGGKADAFERASSRGRSERAVARELVSIRVVTHRTRLDPPARGVGCDHDRAARLEHRARHGRAAR